MAGEALRIISGWGNSQRLVCVVTQCALETPVSFCVAAAQDQSASRVTDADLVVNNLVNRFGIKIRRWLAVTLSAKLILLSISQPARMPNGQTLLDFPLGDGLDVLFAWAMAALALNPKVLGRDLFGQEIGLPRHVARKALLPLAGLEPIRQGVFRIFDRRL